MRQSLLISALTAGTLATATFTAVAPSQAFTLDINPATSFSSNALPYGTTGYTGASGTLDFTFSQFSPTQVLLKLLIANTTGSNTTDGNGATSSILSGVLFDLPTNVTFARYVGDSEFPTTQLNQSFLPFSTNPPSGYVGGTLDIAPKPANPTTTNPFGLANGQSSLVQMLLKTASSAAHVEGSFFYGFQNADGNGLFKNNSLRAGLRFQNVKGGSNASGGNGVVENLLAKPEAIPTPALLPALLAFGAGVFRKKKQEQAQEA